MKILFVAGGLWQKPFVSFLKEKGHQIAIVNPVDTSTTELADIHLDVDITDTERIRRFCQQFKPEFITSDQSDIATAVVSILSDELDLPCNPTEVVSKFSDKGLMERAARTISVPMPVTGLASSATQVKKFAAANGGYPIIIKPLDSTMSRGFRKLDSEKDVTPLVVSEALKFSRQTQLVVQKWVPGEMVTIEGICLNGQHQTLATSTKTGWFAPGINSGVLYPSDIAPSVLKRIIAANDRFCRLHKLQMGFTHAEYIVDGDQFTLIEIGARGGGAGIIDKIVPWVSGVNPYELFHDTIMGKTVKLPELCEPRFAYLKYYRKEDVAGCNEAKAAEIRKIAGVADFQYNFIGKQYVRDENDLRHSMGIYLARDSQEMTRVTARVKAELSAKPKVA